MFKILNKVYDLNLQPSLTMAIFGVQGDVIQMTGNKENVFAFATLIAQRRILVEWKSSTPPTASALLSDMMMFLKVEKIKYFLRGSTEKILQSLRSFTLFSFSWRKGFLGGTGFEEM